MEDSTVVRPSNSIYLSLPGDVSLIAFNYEKQVFISPTFIITGKVGLGTNQEFQLCLFGPCSSPPEKYLTFPHHITGNIGKGRHFFEFGVGGTWMKGSISRTYLLYPILGYRIQPLQASKLNFRVFGQVPFTGLDSDDYNFIFIPLGISFGVSF
jgi:hypothetical protein